MRILPCAVSALLLVGACSDSTKPFDPVTVAHLSVSPAATPIVRGAQTQLKLSARDSSDNELTNATATWVTNAPSIATVSNDGTVTAVSYGATSITATVGTHTVVAEVVVTAAPTTSAYAVQDLGALSGIDGATRHFSDSGMVLARQAGKVYMNGTSVDMPGCLEPITINGRGHVLCGVKAGDSISSYAIWRDGALTPVAAQDTFPAQHFRAFAMNDSDEVSGLFYMPSFVNANCPATGVRCLSLWRSGQPSFPGYDAGGSDVMLLNNEQQAVLQYAMWAPDYGLSATIYDIPTRKGFGVPYGVRAINDNGWAAIDSPQMIHGSPSYVTTTAVVVTPNGVTVLGSGGASGVNNGNVVVGTLTVGAFIWRGAGVSLLTHATTDASWTVTGADEINSRGQILATADNSDGRKAHIVILTPSQP